VKRRPAARPVPVILVDVLPEWLPSVLLNLAGCSIVPENALPKAPYCGYHVGLLLPARQLIKKCT